MELSRAGRPNQLSATNRAFQTDRFSRYGSFQSIRHEKRPVAFQGKKKVRGKKGRERKLFRQGWGGRDSATYGRASSRKARSIEADGKRPGRGQGIGVAAGGEKLS